MDADPNNYRPILLVSCTTQLHVHHTKMAVCMDKYPWHHPAWTNIFLKGKGLFIANLYSQLNHPRQLKPTWTAGMCTLCRPKKDIRLSTMLDWSNLEFIGAPMHNPQTKKNYDNLKLMARTHTDLSHPVQIRKGVLQGNPLSPLLFILFLSD